MSISDESTAGLTQVRSEADAEQAKQSAPAGVEARLLHQLYDPFQLARAFSGANDETSAFSDRIEIAKWI